MPHLQLGWSASFELGAAFLLLSLLLRALTPRWRGLVPAALQAALLLGLYGLWGLVGAHAEGTVVGAQARGVALWDVERRLRVVSEAWVQDLVLPHHLLTEAANAYYVYGHVNLLIVLLAWVWWKHRPAYLGVSAVLVAFTISATAMQLLSVAPPRLLLTHPVVDTAVAYGQSVYGPADPGAVSQLAAMPSIHVGWALLIGLTVVREGRTRWRWLAMVHPALMSLVVVVTGNHYWLDGVAAGGLLAVATVAVWAAARLARNRRPRASVLQTRDEVSV